MLKDYPKPPEGWRFRVGNYPKPPEGWRFRVGNYMLGGITMSGRFEVVLEPKSWFRRLLTTNYYRVAFSIDSDALNEHRLAQSVVSYMDELIVEWNQDRSKESTKIGSTVFGIYS